MLFSVEGKNVNTAAERGGHRNRWSLKDCIPSGKDHMDRKMI